MSALAAAAIAARAGADPILQMTCRDRNRIALAADALGAAALGVGADPAPRRRSAAGGRAGRGREAISTRAGW